MKKLLAISAAALVAMSASAQAQTRILLNCFTPPAHVWCAAVKDWKERVEEVTDGRVRVAIPAKSMSPPPEQINSVRSGLFDAGFQFNGFLAQEVAGVMVSMNPFTGSDKSVVNSVALWRTYQEFFGDIDEFEGVELLALLVNPGANFYSMTDDPILSMEDALNRKMWALPGATAGILKESGGSIVSGPAAQMTEIIQRGVVDGFVGIPPETAVAFNVLPYAKSVTRTPRSVFTATFSFFISDEKWAEISPEDQELIRSVSGEEFAHRVGGIFDSRNASGMELEEEELEIHQASDEFYAALRDAGKPFATKWVGRINGMGVDGAAMLARYQELVNELSSQ